MGKLFRSLARSAGTDPAFPRGARKVRPQMRVGDTEGGEAFSPTRPQFSSRGLIGREKQMARIMRAICQEHAHVVLFAERGRGKSSLANCVVEQLQRMDFAVARASADTRTTFDTLIRDLMRSLPASLAAVTPPDPLEGCESLLPRSSLAPRDVTGLPALFGGRHLTLVVEEFDRIADKEVRSLVADSSKQMSDRGVPVSFLIVGVADELEELVGDNPSVHRSIVPVELPLLSEDSIRVIVERGFRLSGVAAQKAATDLIVEFSRGTPYIAHLLGLRAVQVMGDAGEDELTTLNVITAARQIVAESGSSMKEPLASLFSQDDETLSRLVMQISGGERDAHGRFTVEPATPGEVKVAGRTIKERHWSDLLSAGVVRHVGKPSSRLFSFVSSHLEHYVLLRALARESWRTG